MTRRMGIHMFAARRAVAVAAAAAAALALSALAGCNQGADGAVSVRWRIVDLTTSIDYDPRANAQADGSCAGPLDATDAGPVPEWVVHNVRLALADPASGAPVAVDPGYVIFSCRQREATTSFHIPLGRFAIDLCAFSSNPAVCDEGVTPPPQIRIVKKAEIINLDVIEIGVRPRPPLPPPPDGGIGDAGSPQ